VSAPATAVPITATHNSGAALEARQLTRAYGSGAARFMALRDVSLTVHQGESLAIIGKSGSGKSTLMHLLALLDTPTNGTVMVGGTNASTLSTAQLNRLRNRAFGFVFQQFYLIPGTSVLDNVTLPLKIRGVPPAERKRLGLEVLEQVELLDKAGNRATDLSGGQKQRTVIARALINQPKVIFADEPTGNLDSATGKVIMDLLFLLNEQHGITLVVVTHDEDLARRCGRSLTIMDGTIVNPQTTGEAEEVAFG